MPSNDHTEQHVSGFESLFLIGSGDQGPWIGEGQIVQQACGLRPVGCGWWAQGRSCREPYLCEGERGGGGAGPGCVEEVFCQNFTAGLPGLGQATEVELVPGGATLTVTEDNRRQFVDAYVDCLLNRAVDLQFEVHTNSRPRPLLMLFPINHRRIQAVLSLRRTCCNRRSSNTCAVSSASPVNQSLGAVLSVTSTDMQLS